MYQWVICFVQESETEPAENPAVSKKKPLSVPRKKRTVRFAIMVFNINDLLLLLVIVIQHVTLKASQIEYVTCGCCHAICATFISENKRILV